MADDVRHFEMALLLDHGLARPLSEAEERRLRSLVQAENPRAGRLTGHDLVRAGLVVAATWRGEGEGSAASV